MIQQEQPQPVIRTTPYQSPMDNYGSSIIMLTNPYDELKDMEFTFRGLMEDSEGKTVKVGEPLMNEQGISEIMGMTRAIVNKITIMGNLDKPEISMMMDFAADTLAKNLMNKRCSYNIKSEDRDMIYFKVLSTIFVCMKRPFMEGDRRFWKGSQQEITTRVEGSARKSALGKIIGWGK